MRRSGGNSQHLLVSEPRTETYDVFVVAEAEIILHNKIFIHLDFILIHLPLLHFGKVPGNHVLPGGSHDRILFLTLADVEPRQIDFPSDLPRPWQEERKNEPSRGKGDVVVHICNVLRS